MRTRPSWIVGLLFSTPVANMNAGTIRQGPLEESKCKLAWRIPLDPRYPRNLGTGEPMLTATELRPVEVAVFHDPDRPSFVSLPTHRPGDYR